MKKPGSTPRERSKESQREKMCIKMRGEKRKKGERRRKKNEGRKNEIRENEGNDFKKLKSKYTYIFHEIITKFVSK